MTESTHKCPDNSTKTEGPRALTQRQRSVLNFIENHIRTAGYPPTRAEIARSCGGHSPQSIAVHIQGLVKKGHLKTTRTARGIRLLRPGDPPLIDLSKGAHEDALISASRTLGHTPAIFAERFDRRPDCFVLIDDEALCALNARLGDCLAVHTATQPRTGDLIIARTARTWTCQRFRATEEALDIAGIVVGALRAHTA